MAFQISYCESEYNFVKSRIFLKFHYHDIKKTLNSFSSVIKRVKGARGVIQIFPRKGKVWVMYKYWSSKWNELTPDDMIHNYDMVEVHADYTEKEGVTVAPLVKVAGFISVFHQHLDLKYLWHIPREEMFRFSHRGPSYWLTRQEALTAPTGCWEFDPTAFPLELLKVMTDAEIKGQEKVADTSILERTHCESKEKEKSYVVDDNNVTNGEEAGRDKSVVKQSMVTYSRNNKEKKAEASTIKTKRKTSSV